MSEDMVLAAAKYIQQKTSHFTPCMGIVLGSGLGPLANEIENRVEIPYGEIPEFPVSTVAGHAGLMILGTLAQVPVVCLKGRVHLYEGTSPEKIKLLIRTLKQLGCHSLLLTNAAGSLRKKVGAGEISLINDHINLQHINPMVGPNDEKYGERFFALDNAYDPALLSAFRKTAKQLKIRLHEGVYLAETGPTFETPAEIRAFRTLGADLVGMSTVPEVIVARHCGLKVSAISAVVNLAAGMTNISPSHAETLKYSEIASKNLCLLVKTFFKNYAQELKKGPLST